MKNVRYGILGFGSMGTSHGTWLYGGKVQNSTVTAVCDINVARLEYANTNFPGVLTFQDVDEFFASKVFDAVIIAVPHYLHPPYAIQAMQNGYHVMLEKPAGIMASAIHEMNVESQKHPELKFAMMFNQRLNPLYKHLKELLVAQEIGEIRRISWFITTWWRTQKYYDSSSWRATWTDEGGGILVNQAPHQLDLIQWLFGLPIKTRAFIKYGSHRDISVDDDVTAYYEFPNGATGTFITCTFDPVGTDHLEILGDYGKIVVEDSARLIVKRLFKSEQELNATLDFKQVLALVRGQSVEKLYDETSYYYPEKWDVQHIDALQNFTNHILYDEILVSPGTEGISAVELANAFYVSDWLGRDIAIPCDRALFDSLLMEKIANEKSK